MSDEMNETRLETRLTLGIANAKGDGPRMVAIQEDFETALEMVYPVSQAAMSALQDRTNNIFTKTDGNRVFIRTAIIVLIDEVPADQEEDA